MKVFLPIVLLLVGSLLWFAPPRVQASYEQSYQDYLFQFDLYRKTQADFQVAKNEYLKFKTLQSETTALEKTRVMLSQRDQLLRAYLFVLNEKLNDPNAGLSSITRGQYQTILGNEVKFLESHIQKIPSVGSIQDADRVSDELESHYMVLQTSVRQILVGLTLGQLSILANHYDDLVTDAKTLMINYGPTLTSQEQETINRWVLQIENKRNFYQQKADAIALQSTSMDPSDTRQLDEQYNKLVRGMSEARQYLVEGVSFISELRNSLKYVN